MLDSIWFNICWKNKQTYKINWILYYLWKIGSVKNGKYETELEQLRKERQGDSKFCVFISGEEIYERYHNKLPVFYIGDSFADYVVLEREK